VLVQIDIRPGIEVSAVDARNGGRLRDREQVVIALEVAMEVANWRAAIVGLAELELLDHRAHRAVRMRRGVQGACEAGYKLYRLISLICLSFIPVADRLSRGLLGR